MEPNKSESLAKTIRIDERLRERRGESAAPAASAPGPGSQLGNYLILKQIGEGGMGVVYKAQDTVLDRTVALKILPPHLAANDDFMHRFRTEAYAQARLQHPNIVTLYSMLEVPAGFVLVMEHVEGRTLAQCLNSDGAFAPGEAAWIYGQVLLGVAYAHQMGIVHRDLKPDNIFITRRNEVKIMDFGVAKIVDNHEPTRSRSMVGTLLYISPEQINGRDADFRSDIYTLGIGLFEAVTGRLPFERRTDYGLMHAHVLESPPRPRQLKSGLPRELERVILRAIEKEPNKRFQSAVEFRDALLHQCDRHGLEAPLAEDGAHRRSTLPRVTRSRLLGSYGFDALLVAAAVVLVVSLGLYPGRERLPESTVATTTTTTATAGPPAATAAAAPAPRAATVRRADKPQPAKRAPARDGYDSLRKAWGG